ncbi:general secretion pathway protein GspG [Fischerella thermalis CCMEE 5282]|jgi:type IV pilus assembly protein PilA|uniref:General secretion pathway protein GspG n=1 Tax=Fischerella thermalis CCMEE 5318 TaxID=2019666 RepID=A0A2N6L749_9CYAN|nr:type IV pilin-like G/H family protein [Fischerella thermalis]PMB15595.1 general secretion pathway protein GspG [Fischerella thermalis CCMEE 5282]PMB17827.1 general secretion pathway protein GspG [Fischerella thermalis CCMEE 5318]PMB18423.1 general secretion pathway protein GspG [Fischerella thermalis CCMEE 5319]PMB49729.1 general secretion pathway protein GspG [Fischerella thermalis CCMEE 5205]
MLKPELQAKFLQHLNNRKKKNDEGFTLIELLVVVIIIGVLAAIALPSLLGQVNKAKQSEARNYVGTVNRSQQAYFLEYQKFATNLSELQVGIKSQSENYKYQIFGGGTADAQFKGEATKKALKSYYGLVGTTVGDSATSEALTLAIACESPGPTTSVDTVTTFSTDCKNNFVSLAR